MDDETIIRNLGGATAVAKLLRYDVQRVQNWITRGIPPKEKINRPDLFLPQGLKATKPEVEASE